MVDVSLFGAESGFFEVAFVQKKNYCMRCRGERVVEALGSL